MTNYTNLILSYLLGELTQAEREQFESELEFNEQLRLEYNLQLQLDNYMKMRIRLDEAECDPELELVEAQSKDDIGLFLGKQNRIEHQSEKSLMLLEENFKEHLQRAEIEMIVNKVEHTTGEWVREWHPRQNAASQSPQALEIATIIDNYTRQKKDLPPVRQKRRFTLSGKLIAAGLGATAMLIVIALLVVKISHSSYTESELFDLYYQPLTDNSFQARGIDQQIDKLFQIGVDQYLAANYTDAEQAFDKIIQESEDPLSPEILLYSGLTKTASGDYPEAIDLFQKLLNSSDQYNPEAKWYLGLCYLKNGETEKATTIMKELVDQKFYMKKAQKILKDLKR